MNLRLKEKELKILEALRNNPELESCLIEMIDITQVPLGTLDNGDDAEEAVVESIQKTGTLLLEQWAQKKSDDAVNEAKQNRVYRPHEKKK